MTERVTLKPGDYVSTEGMTQDQCHEVARAFMAAGADEGEYEEEGNEYSFWDLFGWFDESDDDVSEGLAHWDNDFRFKRRLTIDQVLTATNAGGQTQDTLTTIFESAADHDAKAKHHAAEHERLMQQARDMLPDGWRLVRAEDMAEAVSVDAGQWMKGNIAPAQDMADPANWRAGDFVECTFSSYHGYKKGGTYEVYKPLNDGRIGVIGDDDDQYEMRMAKNFRFHRRPNT